MLIKIEDDLKKVLKSVKQEVRRGALDRKHPFRYVVLSSFDTSINSRYVVLRQVDQSFNLIIYTDVRSKKILDINQNPQVQLLFYHPKKQVQVIISGKAVISTANNSVNHHWRNVNGNAKRSYTTAKPPGTLIQDPIEGHLWDESMEEQYFAVLTITPIKIEVLQLNKSEHLRALFSEDDNWAGTWLVP